MSTKSKKEYQCQPYCNIARVRAPNDSLIHLSQYAYRYKVIYIRSNGNNYRIIISRSIAIST